MESRNSRTPLIRPRYPFLSSYVPCNRVMYAPLVSQAQRKAPRVLLHHGPTKGCGLQ